MGETPTKSCINILQEFTISKYRLNPHYTIKDVSPSIHSPRFEVTIEVGKISCSAQSTNKKQAKEMCARLVIDQLGIVNETSPKCEVDVTVSLEDTNYNAVGYLNEYASKNSIPYAEYNDAGTNEKGFMLVECKLGQLDALGFGSNKKQAKQDAAVNLLKKLKFSKTPKKLEFNTPEKIRKLDGHEINLTTSSADGIRNIETEEIIIKEQEEIAEEKSEKHEDEPKKHEDGPEKHEETRTANIPERTETEKTTEAEKAEELSEEK